MSGSLAAITRTVTVLNFGWELDRAPPLSIKLTLILMIIITIMKMESYLCRSTYEYEDRALKICLVKRRKKKRKKKKREREKKERSY